MKFRDCLDGIEWWFGKRSDIDLSAWDEAIGQSRTPLLYATSSWLDGMTSGQWSAWICGDYDIVFPIFPKNKFGISYVTQPFLCQRLGLFGKNADESNLPELLQRIQKGRWKVDLMLQAAPPDCTSCTPRTNHILAIDQAVLEIRMHYHRNVRRNIDKATAAGITTHREESHLKILPFLVRHDTTSLLQRWEGNIREVMTVFQDRGGFAWTADQGGEMQAAAYGVVYGDRVYFLLCQSSPTGKQAAAMYLLIDRLIGEFAGGQYKWFDFTGSAMPTIARRNLGFGATREEYCHYSWRWWHQFTG